MPLSTLAGVLMTSDPTHAPPMMMNSVGWFRTRTSPPCIMNPPSTDPMTMTAPTSNSMNDPLRGTPVPRPDNRPSTYDLEQCGNLAVQESETACRLLAQGN